MKINSNNINFNYAEDYSVMEAYVSLVAQEDRHNLNAYIVLTRDDGDLDNLTPKQMAQLAIAKLKGLLGD